MAPGRGIVAAGRAILQQQRHLSRFNPHQSAAGGSHHVRSWSSDVAVNEAVSTSTATAPESETTQPDPRPFVAILENCPKYALKTEIIHFFHSLALPPDSLKVLVNHQLRFGDWRMTFKDAAQFRVAQEILVLKKSIGSRQLRLVPFIETEADAFVKTLPKIQNPKPNISDPMLPFDEYRGRSLLLFGIPKVAMSDALEKFFEGYQLAGHAFKHFHIKPDFVAPKLRKGPLAPDETRILVKFETRAEALRALKDLHKSMLGGSAAILRLVE